MVNFVPVCPDRAARPVTSTRAVMEVEHLQSSEKWRNTPLR